MAFVIRSSPRKAILNKLNEGVSTPSLISSSLNVNKTHVSRALKELQQKELVECLTQSRKGRMYGITEKGSSIINEVNRLGL